MKGSRIIVTPWRSFDELLQVREWLYPQRLKPHVDVFGPSSVEENSESDAIWRKQRRACDQISAWKLRPPLPHPVESTWLLTEAILADQQGNSDASARSAFSTFSIKAGYATALTRFVTALLDSSQTSKYKVSMYTKAAELRLPAMFVDLRHEATHGEMPNLSVLRDATRKALEWLGEDYWKKLDGQGRLQGEEAGHDSEESVHPLEDDDNGAKGFDMDDIEPWGLVKGPWRAVPIGMV